MYGALGLILVLVVMMSVFTAGGNLIGELFKYLLPLGFMIAFMRPVAGIYTLVIVSISMDTVKRLMIFDMNVGFDNIAILQAFGPVIAGGAILRTILKLLNRENDAMKGRLKMFLVMQVLAMIIGAAYMLTGGMSLHSLGTVANSAVYISLIGCVPYIFPSSEDCIKLFKFVVLMYVPVSLWAIKQGIWGIADFEMDYLLSGYTIEVRQLNRAVFRNMGTLASAPAMSYTASILAAALLIPFSLKHRRLSFGALFNPIRILLILIFAMGAYYTFTRTGWVVGLLAVMMFFIIRSKLLTYTAALTASFSLALLIIFSQSILDSKILNKYQDILRTEVSTSDEASQVLVLGTINGRMESLANLIHNPDVWTPFGIAADGGNTEDVYSHDAITELLVLVGYVPLFVIVVTMIISFIVFYGKFYSLDRGPTKLLTGYFFCLGVGMLLVAFGQLKAMFVFPVNMFWALFIGFGITHYFIATKEKLERLRTQSNM